MPLVFLLMGPLMVEGSYFAVTGAWSVQALVVSIPVGLLVAAILDGNEWRDIGEDTRAGIRTLSAQHRQGVRPLPRTWRSSSARTWRSGWPSPSGSSRRRRCIAILSLPFLAQVIRSAELGATGQTRAIAMIDLQTARLHLAFGALLVAGILLSGIVRA